ncbi:hypothetical protein NP233_g6364 [Leucocoprinus birnbaumii]|uniref:F-box domain-containing protein n=1 Tax=Leucocoprinus birnbaumii TaxID=56174 RepID=A0AAD5VR64_9AGAR|nr:hypothetical protein NP233_g6364 [Leucocoprinus birnbaumii]
MRLPNDVLICEVMSRLSTVDLVRAAKSSNHMSSAVGEAVRIRVLQVLRLFVPAPGSFSRAMREYHAVVGGSCALRVLSQKDFTPDRIDLYVPSAHSDNMITYLKGEGFRMTNTIFPPPFDTGSWPKYIHSFVCMERETNHGNVYIRLHVTSSTSAVMPIFFEGLTSSVNLITPRAVLCCYPQLTLRGIVLVNNPWTVTNESLAQMQSRGFKTRIDPRSEPQQSSVATQRHLKDRHSLFLPFVAHDTEWYEASWEDIEWVCPNTRWTSHLPQGVHDVTNDEGGLVELEDGPTDTSVDDFE